MEDHLSHIARLEAENELLKRELQDANHIIEAIREGAVDALVVNDESGTPQIFALETADYTYRILIEKFSEGALSVSDNGLILYCNDYFANLAGLSSSEVIGTQLTDYLQEPEDFQRLKSAMHDGQAKGEITLEIGGRQLEIYISLSDLEPLVPAIGIVVTDLTEKKRHERALLDYQDQLKKNISELHLTNTNLEQVIHVISHDLKEPLRKILTYISHFNTEKGHLFAAGEMKSLEIVKASALRLNSLLDDIVKYAFTNIHDDDVTIDLNVTLQEVLEDLEINIEENNTVVVTNDLPHIQGSPVQMRQLFANLISNAIKYRKADMNPYIEVRAARPENTPEGFYRIDFRDNGIGMDKNHFTQIFTIFKRLHQRNEYSGNGIGLAICKKIMDNHHGKIEVESELGQGSTFSLFFPIKE